VAVCVQRREELAHLVGAGAARARLAAEERGELAQVGEIGAAGVRREIALVAQVLRERVELARRARAHDRTADARSA
jgi:hypothetical protein